MIKKIVLSFILITAFVFVLYAQNVNIPDANFKAYLVGNSGVNTNGDGEIQVSEAAVFSSSIYVSGLSISDLTGIEAFVNLKVLHCFNNALTTLDLSANIELEVVLCDTNFLSSLDLSTNINLSDLGCGNNSITSLDLSLNPALIKLKCSNNLLNTLDLSNNLAIDYLRCNGNLFTHIDVSMNTAPLVHIYCNSNPNLTSMNIANGYNTDLTVLQANNNPNLFCIQVDDPVSTLANMASIDSNTILSVDCASVGIVEQTKDVIFSIYPNPVHDKLSIDFDGEIQSIVLNDLQGKTVKSVASSITKMDLSDLTKGIYILTIQTDSGFASKKVIKR